MVGRCTLLGENITCFWINLYLVCVNNSFDKKNLLKNYFTWKILKNILIWKVILPIKEIIFLNVGRIIVSTHLHLNKWKKCLKCWYSTLMFKLNPPYLGNMLRTALVHGVWLKLSHSLDKCRLNFGRSLGR